MYPVSIPVFCCLRTNMPEVVPFNVLVANVLLLLCTCQTGSQVWSIFRIAGMTQGLLNLMLQ